MRRRLPASLQASEDLRYLEVSQKVKRLKAATEPEASEGGGAEAGGTTTTPLVNPEFNPAQLEGSS